MRFKRGVDYPHLCRSCKKVVDALADAFQMGLMPDTDDEEAPLMEAGDRGMLCIPDCEEVEDGSRIQ